MTIAETSDAQKPGFVARLRYIGLYALSLLLVLLAPILGVFVALVAAWHAIVAQSIVLLPLAVFLALVIVSVYQRHKGGDILTLGLMLTLTAGWFLIDLETRKEILGWASALVLPVELLAGSLAVLCLLLVVLLVFRFSAERRRRVLVSRGSPK
ncbi:MAG: hypothetical protein ACXIUM_07595 [Wenzhouxiangella sp.]